MAKTDNKSVIAKMQEVCPYYIAKYIEWHFTDKSERKSWEELCVCDGSFKTTSGENKTEEFAKENWLTRDDAQKAIQIYMKHMKTYNLSRIYQKMLDKALSGDVQAAKYIETFSNGSFFDELEDEVNNFLNEINIPGLKGGAKNGSK